MVKAGVEKILCADQGIRLMFLDSQITDRVQTMATHVGLPVLGVHDSFIVARPDRSTLVEMMLTATHEILGVELPVDATEAPSLPDWSAGYRARRQWHWRMLVKKK